VIKMPAARPKLAAVSRTVTGKKVAGLRREGRLHGVVFGHGLESTNVSVDGHEFEQLRRTSGPNALIDLAVDGKRAQAVLVHGVQTHPVSRRPLHIDLFAVRLTEELAVDVPLVAHGTTPLVELQGGTLIHALEHVRVRALPDHLPQSIEYSVESLLDFDSVIHVTDLPIPADVTLLTDPTEVVAKVLRPRVEEEPEVAPEVEAEPAAVAAPRAGEAAPAEAASEEAPES
jgi:large subunit ribosomal protein L25